MSWKVIEKKVVAEFKTEAEADAYLNQLPMEDEGYQKQVVEWMAVSTECDLCGPLADQEAGEKMTYSQINHKIGDFSC